jgi:hypothetical protein
VPNTKKLSGYYKVPMTGVLRIPMCMMTVVVRIVVAAAMVGMMMMLMAMTISMGFLANLLSTPSFDMDVGNMVAWMAVPKDGA